MEIKGAGGIFKHPGKLLPVVRRSSLFVSVNVPNSMNFIGIDSTLDGADLHEVRLTNSSDSRNRTPNPHKICND